MTRLAYLSGPVDAAEVYRQWQSSKHTKLFGTSYLMQFFALCGELGAQALVITNLPGERTRQTIGDVVIENRPPSRAKGIGYHIGMVRSMLGMAGALWRFKPSAFVVTANQNYWFALAFTKLMRTEVIPSAHCVLWRPYMPTPLHWRVLLFLDGLFLRFCTRRAMAVSEVVADQLKSLAGSDAYNVSILLPTYARDHFADIAPADHDQRPFRVLFAGRAEANKGIFDLVAVAERLARERPGEFHFDLCGDGSDLERLRREVIERNLDASVHVHGFCEKDKMADLLSRSHIAAVPTRSDFEEGMPKTCVEAVLADRPFVASRVCPILVPLQAAAIEVAPDDTMGYHDAIVRLADDPALYRAKVDACAQLQPQFYDQSRSYKAVLTEHLVDAGIIAPSVIGRPDKPSRDRAVADSAG